MGEGEKNGKGKGEGLIMLGFVLGALGKSLSVWVFALCSMLQGRACKHSSSPLLRCPLSQHLGWLETGLQCFLSDWRCQYCNTAVSRDEVAVLQRPRSSWKSRKRQP